jgi:tryptophan-rich sensory protein
MSNVGEIQSVLFKQVPGGYVFQQPNPWVFGRSSRYLVSEAQKAALLAIITPRRPILKAVVILAGILLWVAAVAIAMAFFGHDEPTVSDVAATIVLSAGPMFAALVVALQRNLRRMRAVIAGAPRTEERITHAEVRKAMANAMSLKRALLFGAVWTFLYSVQVYFLIIRNARHRLFSDAQSFISLYLVIMAAGFAVHYLVIALRKFRQKKVAV